jgi:hypothetical protein
MCLFSKKSDRFVDPLTPLQSSLTRGFLGVTSGA